MSLPAEMPHTDEAAVSAAAHQAHAPVPAEGGEQPARQAVVPAGRADARGRGGRGQVVPVQDQSAERTRRAAAAAAPHGRGRGRGRRRGRRGRGGRRRTSSAGGRSAPQLTAMRNTVAGKVAARQWLPSQLAASFTYTSIKWSQYKLSELTAVKVAV